jgi:hypothetical protein
VAVTQLPNLLLRQAVEARVAVAGCALVVLPADVGHEEESDAGGADARGDVEGVAGTARGGKSQHRCLGSRFRLFCRYRRKDRKRDAHVTGPVLGEVEPLE